MWGDWFKSSANGQRSIEGPSTETHGGLVGCHMGSTIHVSFLFSRDDAFSIHRIAENCRPEAEVPIYARIPDLCLWVYTSEIRSRSIFQGLRFSWNNRFSRSVGFEEAKCGGYHRKTLNGHPLSAAVLATASCPEVEENVKTLFGRAGGFWIIGAFKYVGTDSCLTGLPHPTVPHDNSWYTMEM